MNVPVLVLALLLAQEDLASFLGRIDKELQSGTATPAIVAEIDKYSEGKSEDVKARLLWNRSLLASLERVNRAYAEAMKKSVGARVEVPTRDARVSGGLAEVLENRLVMTTAAGRVEIIFAKIRAGDRLAEARRTGGYRESPGDAVVVKAADGDFNGALTLTIRIADAGQRSDTLDALAGWVLQTVDRELADNRLERLGGMLKELKERQPALMRAAGGALDRCGKEVVAPRLAAAGDEVALRDKKVARRLYEAAGALEPPVKLRRELVGKTWKLATSGEWFRIPLDDSLPLKGAEIKDGAIVWEDPAQGVIEYTAMDFPEFPVPVAEVTGARIAARIDPAATRALVFWWYIDAAQELGHGVLVSPWQGAMAYKKYLMRGGKPELLGAAFLKKKNEYQLRFELSGGKLKLFVDEAEVYSVSETTGPLQSLSIALDEGRAEIRSLEVRKR